SSMSIFLVPPESQLSLDCLLCCVLDFSPAQVQVRWFQDRQELTGHLMATDVVPNEDWTQQFRVLLETCLGLQYKKPLPLCGITFPCQLEHVSLEHPLSRPW
ncbi:HB2L protein, partial [Brachypodius atriceps]|nr:HB2L protein [Brachypodius atriceps]